MKLGIFIKQVNNQTHFQLIEKIIEEIKSLGIELSYYYDTCNQLSNYDKTYSSFITFNQLIPSQIDFLCTIGGDGTVLNSIEIVGNSDIPIIGINTGRLGFLSHVNPSHVKQAFSDLLKGNYHTDNRTLLEISSNQNLFKFPYALNDFVINKNENGSMLTIHTYLNGELLNSYWADGLIVSTPTGSSGYSLSCGGPIIFPKTPCFVITPIAPHQLNVRPVIVPDNQIISFEVECRSNTFLTTLDSRFATFDKKSSMAIKKADFSIKLVRFNNRTYLKTLREKMFWGEDIRN